MKKIVKFHKDFRRETMIKMIIPGLLIFFVTISFGFLGNFQQDKPDKQEEKKIVDKAKLQKKVTSVFKTHCAVSGCHKGKYPKKKLKCGQSRMRYFDC